MMSKRDDILSAVVTALNATGKPAGLTIERSRTELIDEKSIPLAVVMPMEEKSEINVLQELLVENTLVFKVQVFTKGEPFDKKLDPHVTWIRKAILTNEALNGMVHWINMGWESMGAIQWEVEERDEVYGMASLIWTVQYSETIS